MAAFYILAVDDREYKLKLTTASKIEARSASASRYWRLQRTSHGRKPSRSSSGRPSRNITGR